MSSLTRIIRNLHTLKNTFHNVIRTSCLQSDVRTPIIVRTPSIVNSWLWQQKQSNFRLPEVYQSNITLPSGMIWSPFINEHTNKIIDEPISSNADNTIQAARLIVIRRKKMKKHKLRKLRKRMKFEWAKLRQRRELKKEKLFQAELIQRCKAADAFSAEKFVEERLAQYNEVIIPKTWKGKRLPESLIQQKMGLLPK